MIDGPACNYELYAVMVHGGSIYGGHYTCYIKVDGKWTMFNDSNVHYLSAEAVSQVLGREEKDAPPVSHLYTIDALCTAHYTLLTAHTSLRKSSSLSLRVNADGVCTVAPSHLLHSQLEQPSSDLCVRL